MIYTRSRRIIAATLAMIILGEVAVPNVAFALTGGPSQPEVQGFTPIGTSDMVDVFSGDYSYNIPLLDVGGYPINISYHSNITMDQEASWVGLGWNINAGVINRSMRSVPDDFNGDIVKKEYHIKPNTTYGITFYPDAELFGVQAKKLIKKLGNVGLGFTFNNYTGMGVSVSVSPSLKSLEANKSGFTSSLGISAGSESGVGISPSVSFSKMSEDKEGRDKKLTSTVGLNFNSRTGLQALTGSLSSEGTKDPCDVNSGGMADLDKDGNPAAMASIANGGGSISFASPAYTPIVGHSMLSTNLSISATLGGELFGGHPAGRLEGSFSGQFLLKPEMDIPAYGYLNTTAGSALDKVMLDFNREKDGSFTEHTPSLPLTSFNYDIYSVSGQGIGGMYRPFRGDVGVLFDSKVTSISGGIDIGGIEIGVGNLSHPGINLSLNQSRTKSGKWEDNNTAATKLQFRKNVPGNDFESVYFKQAGEKNAENDMAFFNSIGGFNPARIELDASTEDVTARAKYDNLNLPITSNNKRASRARRNEVIGLMSADEANQFAEVKQIENYPVNTFTLCSTCTSSVSDNTNKAYHNRYQPTLASRIRPGMGHHTSQITSVRADGARYVYGIPAYNNTQSDVTFAVNGNADCQTGLVSYNPGTDDSKNNSSGIDNYFDKTTLPAYAHSYLLTEVLSADYVDVKGDGPTGDDLGTYTKINYSKPSSADYKWRVPFESGMANFNEGLKSVKYHPGDANDIGDDKGSYIYGEKEIWYIHSIETKNYVAEFTLADREDANGVAGTSGGISTAVPMKRLVKIDLYSRQDKIVNGASATPIKTVHFQYDYSLCPGIPNNTGDHVDVDGNTVSSGSPDDVNANAGKLTLKKIFFTYGNSFKGKLSPYEFFYSDTDHNPSTTVDQDPSTGTNLQQETNYMYNLKGYDRWGNYKPNPGHANCDDDPATSPKTTSEFPYTTQSSATDLYAAAWCMTSISLPSGGTIKIDYESDDYAYVQDKRAMDMVTIEGATNVTPGSVTSTNDFKDSNGKYPLYDALSGISLDDLCSGSPPALSNRKYLYFKVGSGVSTSNIGEKYFQEKDGRLIENLYFKFLINLKGDVEAATGDKAYEYVPGYVKIASGGSGSSYGVITIGTQNYGWVKLEAVPTGDKGDLGLLTVNPISQAAWNFTRLYLPRVAYNQPDRSETGVMQIFHALVSTAQSMVTLITGFNKSMLLRGCAYEFVPAKSFIRLYDPLNFKKGGGSRVKRLALSDEWKDLLGATTVGANYITAEYGQEYDYTTKDEYGQTISSGVAGYEPMVGGDENPFRQPVFFEEKHLLVANEDFMQETPYGESFFPGPGVGYSKVTVKNLQYDQSTPAYPYTVTRNATGKVVHEFYTARDFPTITNFTTVNPIRKKPNPLFKFLKIRVRDFMTASQGYVVELNDMHGKQKSQKVYQEGKADPISGVEYTYRTAKQNITIPFTNQTIQVTGLNNNVLSVDKNNVIAERMVGVDYDFTVDMRESKSTSRCAGPSGNLDNFLVGVVGVAVPIILPSFAQEKTRFRSAVTTKIINRYGILETTTAFDLGSRVSTVNKLVDAETGEVLLTETVNQFDDPIYALTYPAHWAYERMGQAYKNSGITGTLSQLVGYFALGDEISYKSTLSGNYERGWIIDITPPTVKVADRLGFDVTGYVSGDVKILRSGRRNMQNTPIGNVTSLHSPMSPGNNPTRLDVHKGIEIINASSIEFSEQWKLFCECGIDPGNPYNKYVMGTLGNWRPTKSFLHLTGRTQSRKNNNTNVRKDGIFTSFNPFWVPPSPTGLWTKDETNWQFTSEVTIFSPFGPELENRDALGRYSGAIYAYNNTLPIAVASNARYKEIAFDSFEDYLFDECDKDHFSFEENGSSAVVSNKSHAGRKSIKVASGQTISVSKQLVECGSCAVEIVVSSPFCNYPNSGSANLTANPTGTGPFTYSWAVTSGTGGFTSSTSNPTHITYFGSVVVKVTVTDNTGCVSENSVALHCP